MILSMYILYAVFSRRQNVRIFFIVSWFSRIFPQFVIPLLLYSNLNKYDVVVQSLKSCSPTGFPSSPSPRVCSNSCPLSRWYHPTISSSVMPFFSCLQSCPESGSFPVSLFFTSGGQSIRVSASASFLPKKIQGWSLSEWTGWISLQSKGLSRVFSNTTVQKHRFFSTQPSSQSNSHIHSWPLEKP